MSPLSVHQVGGRGSEGGRWFSQSKARGAGVRVARSCGLALLLTVAAFAVLATAVPSVSSGSIASASDSTSHWVTDLGTLGPNKYSFAYGINDVGQAVGSSGDAPVLFDSGRVVDLGTVGCPVAYADDVASDINDAGQVVGTTCYRVGRPLRAFLSQNGTMTDLGTLPGGTWASARAINSMGQIAGTSELQPYQYYAVTWENGGITNLGALPGQTLSMAYGINDAGQVVGFSGNGPSRAVLWENGQITDLGALPGGDVNRAYGINNRGQVVGVSSDHAFLWEGGTMTDLGTLPGPEYMESYASAINDAGQIVGASQNASGSWHAFLWEGGTMTDLGTLPGPGNTESYATAINEAGQIVGTSVGMPYGYRAVLWVQPPVHGVAVTSAAASPLSGPIGARITISAEVKNDGSESDAFDVQAFAGSILVGTQRVIDLGPGESRSLSFVWETSGAAPQLRRSGSYPVKVVAAPLPQEINLANNEHGAGTVVLTGWARTQVEPRIAVEVGQDTLFACRVSASPCVATDGSIASGASATSAGAQVVQLQPRPTEAG